MAAAAPRIRPVSIMWKSQAKPARPNGDRKRKSARPRGSRDSSRRPAAVCLRRRLRRRRRHECARRSRAAPMIGKIFKEIYKGQKIAGKTQRRAQENQKSAAPSRSKKKTSQISRAAIADLRVSSLADVSLVRRLLRARCSTQPPFPRQLHGPFELRFPLRHRNFPRTARRFSAYRPT